jgi:hypothetical protein
MSWTTPDMADRLIVLLQAKGYQVHTDGDGNPAFLQPPGCRPEDGHWFTWMAPGMAEPEVGDTYGTELEAWGSAMEHFFANASIPLHTYLSGPPAQEAARGN